MTETGTAQEIEAEDAAIEAAEQADRATVRTAYLAIAGASYGNPALTIDGAILLLAPMGGELITYLVMELAEIGEGPAVWALSHIKANYAC